MECSFHLKQKLCKQTGIFHGGGLLSVTLLDIHTIRTESVIIKPLKPVFYKGYDDDIYSHRENNRINQLYCDLNNYLPNISLTIEMN